MIAAAHIPRRTADWHAFVLAASLLGCTTTPAHEPAPMPAMPLTPGPPQMAQPAMSGTASGSDTHSGQSQSSAGQTAPAPDAGKPPPQQQPEVDAALPASDAAVITTPTCPASVLVTAGNHDESVMHDGLNRSYVLHVPPGYDGTKALPVVADFHGYTSNAAGQQSVSGWDALADREGFFVVYPEGIDSSWNIGNDCCGNAGSQNVDDIGFAKAVIEHVRGLCCVDPKRVYASGLSNGGGFAHRIGCDAADVFAAVAPVSTDLRTMPCKPARPISEMSFRGTGDVLEPYEGGEIGPPGMTSISPGAKGSLALWKMLDQCTDVVATADQYCETYAECADGVEVALCTMPDVGHVPYDNALGFSIVETAWNMFARHTLP